MENFIVVLVLVTTMKMTVSTRSSLEELPLTKSLGYSITKKLTGSLEDDRLSKEYLEQYEEMLRASQESRVETAVDRKGRKLRGAVNDDDINVLKNTEESDHRRRSPQIQSEFRRRHARCQAHRREKLNAQSLRNHVQHSRKIRFQ